MKRLLVTGVALVALTGAAMAADLPPGPGPYYKAPVMPFRLSTGPDSTSV